LKIFENSFDKEKRVERAERSGETGPEKDRRPNRLIHEKSPYLLQHADNPVDWYPWGDEAFEKAKQTDRPVFLSIGYSTCHWCHVMERESFSDTEVASIMNDHFVSIKVDREERPDIDALYMITAQMMTGRGGWPLTILMTPEKKPFYAATYIPKYTRGSMVGMMDLLKKTEEIWRTRREELEKSADHITALLKSHVNRNEGGDTPGIELQDECFDQLSRMYDQEHGGFGNAPKFPTPHLLSFLLHYWKRTGRKEALDMVDLTLRRMRMGGMYDHVGFGFHRYSTDREWRVPHFEKMLYDQALMAYVFIEAYEATGESFYGKTAEEILSYVLRDMTSPEGGFYTAEDADTEGDEGRYYLWQMDELRSLLGGRDTGFEDAAGSGFDLLTGIFELREPGNTGNEEEFGRGANILIMRQSIGEYAARQQNLDADRARDIWERCRVKLLGFRRNRTGPARDGKILTDWNSLMVAALARAGRTLDPLYLDAARRGASFILRQLRNADGSLLHTMHGKGTVFLEDYGFFIIALLELYRSTFDPLYLEEAVAAADRMIGLFEDKASGGFFSTPDNGEKHIVRLKEGTDGSLPSGNGAAAQGLIRLARLTGKSSYEEAAVRTLRAFSSAASASPTGHVAILDALGHLAGPSFEIVITGDPKKDDVLGLIRELNGRFLPNSVVVLKPANGNSAARLEAAAPFLSQYASGSEATAYVCSGSTCRPPTGDPSVMLRYLGE